MKKKVCIDVRYIRETPTGVARYIKELTERLLKNQRFDFFLLGDSISLSSFREHSDKFTAIETPNSPENHPAHDCWLNFTFPKLIKNHKIGLFHATAFMLPLRKIDCRIITTIHDRVAKAYPKTLPFKFRFFLNVNVKYSLKHSNHIICMSEFTQTELQKEFKKLPPIEIIPLGVTELNKINQKYSHPLNNTSYILYMGSIEPRKGLDNLIKSFIEFKKSRQIPHKLIIVGKQLWGYKRPFQIAEASDFKKDIIFTGYLSDEEINNYYRFASLTAIPSLYEGFGLPVLEAMRYPVPVLVNDIPVFRETSDKAAFFTDFSNHKKTADIINKLLETDKDEVYFNNQATVNKYTWKKNAELTENLYDKVLS